MGRSSEEPEVLLPPGADEVAADALALLPHRQRQALGLVDALLHQLLPAAPRQAATTPHTHTRVPISSFRQGLVEAASDDKMKS